MGYRVIVALYGLINLLGGLMAFLTVGSQKSLIVGGIAGVMLLVFSYTAKRNPGLAFRGAAALSLMLALFWVYRINELNRESKPIMMAVGNMALGIVVFAVLGAGHMIATRKQKTAK